MNYCHQLLFFGFSFSQKWRRTPTCTIRGSALLPSLNSSRVSRSSWFLSIWSKILSTLFCGVFSSSVCGCWPFFEKIFFLLNLIKLNQIWYGFRFCLRYVPPFDKLHQLCCTFHLSLWNHHYQRHTAETPLWLMENECTEKEKKKGFGF